MIISRFSINVKKEGGYYGKISCSPLPLEIGEAFLISNMKGESHFEYTTNNTTQENAIQIANSIGIEVTCFDNHYTFHADIDTSQIQYLDKKLNTYSIRYTYSLCEEAAYDRVKKDIFDLNAKPPLWAIEALTRIIRRCPESKASFDAKELFESVISQYTEYAYLAAWF